MPLTASDLVVENGTGLSNANTYIDIAFADAYHRLRDSATWADQGDHEKVAALIRATQYLDQSWAFVGEIEVLTQALAWPRIPADLTDAEGRAIGGTVPVAVKNAAAEYALRALDATTPLLPDPARDEYPVKRKFVKVGEIEEEVEYTGGSRRGRISYPAADNILRVSGLVVSLRSRCDRA